MSFLLSPLRRSAAAAAATPSSVARAFSSTRPSQLSRMTIVGRLGADPETHESSSGRQYVRYVIGTDSGARDNRTTSWFRVTSFAEGASREYIQGLKKGTLVYFEGDASMNTYEDKNGQTQSALNLVQTKVEVLKRAQPKEEEQ